MSKELGCLLTIEAPCKELEVSREMRKKQKWIARLVKLYWVKDISKLLAKGIYNSITVFYGN